MHVTTASGYLTRLYEFIHLREASVTVTTIHPRFEHGFSYIETSCFTATVTLLCPSLREVTRQIFIITDSDMNSILRLWSNFGHPNFPGNVEETNERRRHG
jgi:hypothetical protein